MPAEEVPAARLTGPFTSCQLLNDLRAAIEVQTVQLSGEIAINRDLILAAQMTADQNGGRVERLTAEISGDSVRPGLIRRTEKLEQAEARDDAGWKYAGFAWRVAKWASPIVLVAIGSLGTWIWNEHVATASNTHKIEILEVKVEQLGASADENLQAILRAIRE